MHWFAQLVALCFGCTFLAGCVGGSAGSADADPQARFEADALGISGLVVDVELVPIEGAEITNDRNDIVVATDALGRFALGPLEPGDYVLTVQKKGYEGQTRTVTVTSDPVRDVMLTLVPVASDVPYHLTFTRATFIICWSQNIVGGVPCTKLVDYVAGTNVSSTERFAFTFSIPNEGMADMLVEIVWKPQALGRDMGFYIQTPPNQPLTGLVVKYFSKSGGTPIRGWVVAGIKNRCGGGECAGVFDATPNKVVYEGVTIGSQGNATIPLTSVYLNHRTDAWFTTFYNRPGTREFTAVPDN